MRYIVICTCGQINSKFPVRCPTCNIFYSGYETKVEITERYEDQLL